MQQKTIVLLTLLTIIVQGGGYTIGAATKLLKSLNVGPTDFVSKRSNELVG